MSKKQPTRDAESRTRFTRTTPAKPKGATREPKAPKQPKRGELPVGKYATPTAPALPATAWTHTFMQPKHPKHGQRCYLVESLPNSPGFVTARFPDGSNQVVSRQALREIGGAA